MVYCLESGPGSKNAWVSKSSRHLVASSVAIPSMSYHLARGRRVMTKRTKVVEISAVSKSR